VEPPRLPLRSLHSAVPCFAHQLSLLHREQRDRLVCFHFVPAFFAVSESKSVSEVESES